MRSRRNNPGRHARHNNTCRNIVQHNCASTDNGILADLDSLNYPRTKSNMRASADPYAACNAYAWTDMGMVANNAVVIDYRTRVDQHIRAQQHAALQHGSRHQLHAMAYNHVGLGDSMRINYGFEREAQGYSMFEDATPISRAFCRAETIH
jgi:hypothetical protein